MARKESRYKQQERYMTYALLADAAIFIFYLIAAGSGIVWLKVILAILGLLLSAMMLGLLYLTKELLRQRSLWISVGAAAVFVCLLFSLILNFPSPNKYKIPDTETSYVAVIQEWC